MFSHSLFLTQTFSRPRFSLVSPRPRGTVVKTFQSRKIYSMEKIEHKQVKINDINMHIAEKGKGPTILFLHGFPELWYSWRHQILYFAAHGYHAVAPDLRGYGSTTTVSSKGGDASKFSIFHLVEDIVSLIDVIAPNEEKILVVGHNWGTIIAWYLCLFRPDRVKAFVALSVHFLHRNPDPAKKFADVFRVMYGDDHYIWRFQEPGDIESEFAKVGVKKVLKKFLTFRDPASIRFPKTEKFINSYDAPVALPPWLSDDDLNYYVANFQKTGFTEGINYYRALNLDWELLGPWTGAQVKVPAKFMVGELDLVYHMPGAKEYIHEGGFKKDVPLLDDEIVVMEGVAHYINQEKPEDVNNHIHHFFQKHS
ncbi:epoxide hydrolase A-like [Impatiens glandulifera]|uniref:epoxide hydrolase A-like n=1 Tax=Impatiens glandulifera TaxID=253017 RepID=UPI001FB051AE|nr:epoxide hydrolase A-like [Impatiens glandulifera]